MSASATCVTFTLRLWYACLQVLTVVLLALFRYGQLSAVVEPLAGLLGALAVTVATPLLPYALAFAAGAMIYVVVDDIIPEAQTWYVMSTLS